MKIKLDEEFILQCEDRNLVLRTIKELVNAIENDNNQNKTNFEKVKEFHEKFGLAIRNKPDLSDVLLEERNLRLELLREEYEDEYLDAEETNNITEIADALGDMLYIIYGTAVSYGIPIDKVFDEIHNSNMSKLGPAGKPMYREDGKVMKGPNYFKPDIKKILDNE